MRFVDVVDRMETAQGEAGRDAWLELERRLEEEALQRTAVLVVVVRLACCGIRPAERPQFAPINRDRRAEDRSVARKLAVARGFLEQHLEAVARLQLTVEIDLAAEHVRQIEGELDILTRGVDGADERRRAALEPGVD